ncbi:MAG: nicotinate-nucleotide adenylyltransferase [Verrucomicrobiota bacterium]
MRKIGIYGGTFDPIHHGHLILAREALEMLGLEKLIFVPAAVSPHKIVRTPTHANSRVEMLQAALMGEPGFFLDQCELRRGAPSYTIDTVEEIRQREGAAEYFFLIGDDNLARLETWHRFNELRQLVQFVVLSRGNAEAEKIQPRYPVIHRQINISATDIRNRVATGHSISYLVPPSVEEIIRRRQIYQEQDK